MLLSCGEETGQLTGGSKASGKRDGGGEHGGSSRGLGPRRAHSLASTYGICGHTGYSAGSG